MFSGFKPVMLMIAGALVAAAMDRAVPAAVAQGDVACGVAQSRPCELTGFKVLSNQRAPELRLLQIETKQGLRTFIATRATMERFAKELLATLQTERL